MTAASAAILLLVLGGVIYLVLDHRRVSRQHAPVPLDDLRTAKILARLDDLTDRLELAAQRFEAKYGAKEEEV